MSSCDLRKLLRRHSTVTFWLGRFFRYRIVLCFGFSQRLTSERMLQSVEFVDASREKKIFSINRACYINYSFTYMLDFNSISTLIINPTEIFIPTFTNFPNFRVDFAFRLQSAAALCPILLYP